MRNSCKRLGYHQKSFCKQLLRESAFLKVHICASGGCPAILAVPGLRDKLPMCHVNCKHLSFHLCEEKPTCGSNPAGFALFCTEDTTTRLRVQSFV
jgi:hypothetical protein